MNSHITDQIINLPDLPKSIVLEYLLPNGFVKLQKTYRNYLLMKKSGWRFKKCFDCNKFLRSYKQVDNGVIIDACISGCCSKYVCKHGCKLKCSNGHININFDNDDIISCTVCNENITTNKYWLGYKEDRYAY